MRCSCNTLLEALGTPSCFPALQPIKRVIFVTDPTQVFPNTFNFTTQSATRDFFTPILYNVESDRAEPVVEELDGVKFFVRDNVRSFQAIIANPPTTWGYYLEKVRCLTRAGVILIDADGNAWGIVDNITGYSQNIRPIPIVPASLAVKLQLPTNNAITKYVFSFDFDLTFKDYQLKIINSDSSYLTHQARVPAYVECAYDNSNNTLTVRVYTSYQTVNNSLITMINNVTPADIVVRDSANNTVSLTFTQVSTGVFTASTSSLSAGTYTVTINYSTNNLYRFDDSCEFTI